MKEEFITYQKFNDPALAEGVADILSQHAVQFETEKAADYFDPTFTRSEINQEIRIKLRSEDFEKADKLFEAEAAKDLDEENKNHYLYNFSEKELLEILAKPDEWNPYDYLMAQKVLKERGKEVDAATLAQLKKQRNEELHKPEESQMHWVIFGYVFALAGALVGLLIGWHLHSFKKTLPNGERIYAYRPEDRRSGKIIFFVGVASSIFWVIVYASIY